MAPAISIALGLAQYVPGLARLLIGDKAGDVADKVVTVANTVAGVDDPEAALKKIQQSLDFQAELNRQATAILVAELEAETKQLEAINATMQAEVTSGDPFVRRWRPFFGYIVAVTWFLLMVSLGVVIIAEPKDAPDVINAMASLSVMWSLALAVLGISINKRSQDKQVMAGQEIPPGLLQTIVQRIAPPKQEATKDG